MAGPLSGFRVLEIATVMAGPSAGSILADQGAEVVKVEPPGTGDILRLMGSRRNGYTAMFASYNRGKRSIVVDMSQAEGVELVKAIARESDVLLQNLKVGSLERMGLGVDAIRAVNDRLVYASITGFGLEGRLAGEPAYDTVLQALTGFTWAQRDFEDGAYQIIRLPVVDLVTGLQMAQAITAALVERERSGKGQHVEVSLLASALALVFPVGMQDRVLRGLDVQKLAAISDVSFLHRTADGWIVIQPGTDAQCRAVARAAGREDWLEDPRFATAPARMKNFVEWTAELGRSFTGRTNAEWLELLAKDVPIAPALDPETLLEHPGIVEANVLRECEHPTAGRMLEVRPPAVFSRTPGERRSPAPRLGEHTDEILGECGFDEVRIGALRQKGIVA